MQFIFSVKNLIMRYEKARELITVCVSSNQISGGAAWSLEVSGLRIVPQLTPLPSHPGGVGGRISTPSHEIFYTG